jgi:hypothetical protein
MATSTWSFQQFFVSDKDQLEESNKQQPWNQLRFYEKVQRLNLSSDIRPSITNDTAALEFFINQVNRK